jgi:hypothetical protein
MSVIAQKVNFMHRHVRAALLLLALIGGSITAAGPASASQQPITIVKEVNIRPVPNLTQKPIGFLPAGAHPDYLCYTHGVNIGGTDIWFKVVWQGVTGYYTSFNDDVPVAKQSNLEGYYHIPQCGTGADINQSSGDGVTVNPAPTVYHRQAAVTWALTHARDWQDIRFPECTWFVSQALWYGGLHQNDTWNQYGFHGNPLRGMPGTPTATAVKLLSKYLVATGFASEASLSFSRNAVPQAKIGDIIAYDWDGNLSWDHLAFIVNIAPGQYPEVAEWGTALPRDLNRSKYTKRGWTYTENHHTWIQAYYGNQVKAKLIHLTVPEY